jgi:hypothetical protein
MSLRLTSILLVGTMQLATAAEFTVAGVDHAGCDLLGKERFCASASMTGRIERGDAAKLVELLRRLDQSMKSDLPIRLGMLYLDSPGGLVAEAIELGQVIRKRQIATFVTNGSTCSSSCVLVLASGVHRGAAGSVQIHSFYSPEFLGSGRFAEADRMFAATSKSVDSYLQEMRVSRLLLDEMIKVPHSKVRILSMEDLVALGLIGIDPAYSQVRRPKR